jgi:esterase/lipase superfamily enzyme
MNREYHKWSSDALGREMELLIFGHAGVPVVVFPTAQGRFYDWEDRGMVNAVAGKLEKGEVQFFCVDSVDSESWCADNLSGRQQIERHMQFEKYVLDEVLPLLRKKNISPNLAVAGCSFGGFHAANFALRYPEKFTAMLSMGGIFDVAGFLHGYYDKDCYLHLPTHFIPNLSDPAYLDKYRHNSFTLATGVYDKYWDENEKFAALLRRKGIPIRLDVWQDGAGHTWPWWQKMLAAYL